MLPGRCRNVWRQGGQVPQTGRPVPALACAQVVDLLIEDRLLLVLIVQRVEIAGEELVIHRQKLGVGVSFEQQVVQKAGIMELRLPQLLVRHD